MVMPKEPEMGFDCLNSTETSSPPARPYSLCARAATAIIGRRKSAAPGFMAELYPKRRRPGAAVRARRKGRDRNHREKKERRAELHRSIVRERAAATRPPPGAKASQ